MPTTLLVSTGCFGHNIGEVVFDGEKLSASLFGAQPTKIGMTYGDAELSARTETAERARAEALSQKEALDLALAAQRDLEAIRQSITIRLRFFRGEWFLDETAGLPYFQEILIKNPQVPALQSVFRAELLKVPGVSSVESLSLVFDKPGRELAVTFRVMTDTGAILEGTV